MNIAITSWQTATKRNGGSNQLLENENGKCMGGGGKRMVGVTEDRTTVLKRLPITIDVQYIIMCYIE